MDDSDWEREVVLLAEKAIERAQGEPWAEPLQKALEATRQIGGCVAPFLGQYASELEEDNLPSLWDKLEST